uniref:Putative c2h2-type zn-finger protein n=1 Tax=Culex tarsalis TaxID=7177 RepID=A0A1Q3FBU6_CULTA
MFVKTGSAQLELQLELPAETTTYCRLCLARDNLVELVSAGSGISPGGRLDQLIELIFECTNVRLSPDAEPGCAICRGCQGALAEFQRFRSQAKRVDELIKSKAGSRGSPTSTSLPASIEATDKTEECEEVKQQQLQDQSLDGDQPVDESKVTAVVNVDRKRAPVEFLAVATTKRPRLVPTAVLIASSNGGKHKCRYCPSSFKTPTGLTEHTRAHHNRQHQCSNCLEQFQHAPSLARHIRNRTCYTFTKYRCRVCTESFLEQEHWAEHIKIHAKDFPYQCQECLSQFKHKATLRRHVNTVHLLQY